MRDIMSVAPRRMRGGWATAMRWPLAHATLWFFRGAMTACGAVVIRMRPWAFCTSRSLSSVPPPAQRERGAGLHASSD